MGQFEEKKSGLSESFIIGVIAIVFLIVGYQTALFIHHAAVVKIAANRDVPDTVFVHVQPDEGVQSQKVSDPASRKDNGIGLKPVPSVRQNSGHVPRTENFRFDPNTVSVNDLRRLGFTQKQAQSIDNYRRKGGRFRRKGDFAKSFVVSDSIYRRLEPYIDIPLIDLNLADSAAFDALPGIGGWFATKIIEYRNVLGGYSYKEQLLDIYRFDHDKYDELSDLITVSEEYVTPYPLWSLPADSLRKHPYIGSWETARAIVLYRENSPEEQWTIDGLREAGVLTALQYEKLSGCYINR